jgi:hypothetical protein
VAIASASAQKVGGMEAWMRRVRMVLLMVAKHTLCFATLLGSVGARMAKQNATTRQEGRHGVIDEFSAIVGLKALGNGVKLSLNMGNKVNKVTIDVGFLA